MGRSAARAFAALGALAIVGHVLGGTHEDALYDSIGLAAAGLTVVGAAWYRPPNIPGWLLLAAAEGLFAAGDQLYDGAFPGRADGLYLAGYVLWIGAYVLLIRHERFGRHLGNHIDACIVTVSLGASLWVAFLDERLPAAAFTAKAVSFAYPTGDLVLLGLLVRLAFEPGRRSRSYWWLVAGTVLMPVADVAYVIPAVADTFSYGVWVDVIWLGSYVALAAAALDPSLGAMTARRADADEAFVSVRRLAILGGAVLTIPVAVVVSELWHGYVDAIGVALVAGVIAGALTWRVALIVRDLVRMRDRVLASERKFRMVFERSPIGISVGSDGMMSETNPALQQMLGYDGAELARMHYSEITHADDRDLDVQAELDARTRDGFSVDKRYVAKNGRVVAAHVHVALEGADGLGVALIEDVTGKHELEEQFRQAQKMDAVGKLAGGIAHDFNNLMTAVIGYSDLLLPTFAGDPRGEKLEAIRESAERASELTRQLLAFSRRQMLQTSDLDLRDVVARMDSLLARLIGEDVRVRTLVGAEPIVVRADRTQLEQVVMNLVVNARDAIESGGTITIAVLSDGEDALLTVADDGVGMDHETKERIFEPFFTTKPVGEGSGLGLSTVHGIVGQSGGTIDVESSPGLGSLFTVRLPRHLPDPLPAEAALATLVD